MSPSYVSLCLVFFLAGEFISDAAAQFIPFSQNYIPDWGNVNVLAQGREVQIKLDPYSGGGFVSRQAYGSGLFRMNAKIPRNSKGAVTTIYLTSVSAKQRVNGNHDELDFELIGNNGPPYILNTNVFAQDSGGREQQFKLWFDPTLDYHNYEILWNHNQIVFSVDGLPIRVFKNHKNNGVRFPFLPMIVETSLWNGTQWLGPVNWGLGPFLANYREFGISGCPFDRANPTKCLSSGYSWNAPPSLQLSPQQQRTLQDMRNKHLTYDYCKSNTANRYPECHLPE